MEEPIKLVYHVDAEDFSAAGTASSEVRSVLKRLGLEPEVIRRVSICMYEGEINMVIHANGGVATVYIYPQKIVVEMSDTGPGIPDVPLAMQAGYSTASEKARNLGFGAGMGLPNIEKCSDEMKIETEIGKGTIITMTVFTAGRADA